METKTISVCSAQKRQVLTIGRQLENNYRQIVFDCSGFGVEVTSITLVHQRSKDTAPYLVTTSASDTLTWTVTDTDTAYSGYGKAELRISFASGLAKSAVFTTVVIHSITADTVIPSALQSWYDAMIAYIDNNSISQEELEQAIEDYIALHPLQAPVTSVNTLTGDVVITASDLGALTVELDPVFGASAAAGITSADITTWNNKSDFSGDYDDLTDKPTIPSKTSQLQNDSGFITSAPVQSVDGKTGAVTVLPTGGTTGQVLAKKTNADRDVEWVNQSGGGGAVDSVNGQTGTVVLDASDVGALPDNTTIDDVYWCTYGTTTSAQIETALTAGKIPMVKYQDYVYTLRFRNSATNHRFVCNYGGKEKSVVCQSGTWMPNGDLTFLTSAVTSFNGSTGAVTYTAPVTSVNGQTGAVTAPNTTYTISISGNVITLTPSSGAVQTITLPVYGGGIG